MSLLIELWLDGRPVDGFETGWDEVERLLAKTDEPAPLLREVDPYSDLTIDQAALSDLVSECDHLLPAAAEQAERTLVRLRALSLRGLTAPSAELQFKGD